MGKEQNQKETDCTTRDVSRNSWMHGWTAALQHGLERKQPDRTLYWTAPQHCSFCLHQEAVPQASCQGCTGRGWTYQKLQGSKAFSAQKPIPHLQFQLSCEGTWHKGLILVTAKSHTSLLNFRGQQPIVKFWQLMLGEQAKILLPTLATSKEIYDPVHIAEGWETTSSMTL